MTNAANPPETKRGWRSFGFLLALQTQNAFNDNFARYLLVPLIGWLVAMQAAAGEASALNSFQYVLGLCLVVPFLLFSPFAGWLADRLPKNRVVRWSVWFQLIVLCGMLWALSIQSLVAASVMFFLLATQSALLSPAKMGIVKELVPGHRLGLASGLMEMFAILAILGGQILAGFVFAAEVKEVGDGWEAAMGPVKILTLSALVALVCGFLIQKTPSQTQVPLSRDVIFSHLRELRLVVGPLGLARPALLVAFFWGFAGFLNLICIQLAQELGGGTEMGTVTAWLLIAASGGIAIGSGVSGYLSRKKIEVGLAPIGGLVMTLGATLLTFSTPGGFAFHFWLGFVGFGASMLVVPMTAVLLEESPVDKRGSVISASNILNNAAGVLGVVAQGVLRWVGVPVWGQCALLTLVAIVLAIYLVRTSGAEMIRFIGERLLRVFYKIDVRGVENLPKDSGALLLPNHVTYADAFVLSLGVLPRKLRFLMDAELSQRWWARSFVKMFNTVPISPKKAKEAISITADAVKEGGLVTIYPEGQLTRTGMLNELRGGYMLIARRAQEPVVPIYVDGLWGSVFSYSDGKFLKKWPTRWSYDVRIEIGKPYDVKDMPPQKLQEELARLGWECWRRRRTEDLVAEIDSEKSSMLSDQWSELSNERKKSLVLNALALSEVYPTQRGKRLHVVPLGGELDVLFTLVLPAVSELEVSYGKTTPSEVDAVLCRERVRGFDGLQFTINSQEGYPVFVSNDCVLALGMPDPPGSARQFKQLGNKQGAMGRLLPGYAFERRDDGIVVTAPWEEEFSVTGGIDAEGFVNSGETGGSGVD